ncbi:hypothetical protein IB223_12570 [Pseudoxanthomonas sp. PXM03]|uniref:hypothetical protein n=1 Tax=Pseudoxanthomonas sp. PXM03 TaxID=2769284 RepID=UPI001784FEA0|nr:hypothetical protein [Pseudoxanthomonas sp. PXM03]MBD9436928.1 hypothetical protein [Pseudoxanthomonas sp. PXM03]
MGDASNCIAVRVGDHVQVDRRLDERLFRGRDVAAVAVRSRGVPVGLSPRRFAELSGMAGDNAFLTVQTFVFWSIALLLQRWVPGLPAWSVLVSTVYGVFSLMQLFQPYARWKLLLRGLLGYGLFFVVIQMVMGIAVAVVMATSTGG